MKIEKTKMDYILQGLSFICLLSTSLYFLFNWNNIEAKIPAHYSNGVIDRMGDKSELIILIAVAWVMFIGIYLVGKYPKIWNIPVSVNENNRQKVYQVTRHLLSWEMLIMTVNLCFLSVYPLTNKNLPSFYMPVFLGMVIGLIIIYLIKLFRVK